MSNHDHLRIEDLVSATRRPDGPAVVARQVQRHLVEVCEDCGPEWTRLADLRPTYLERIGELPGPTSPPPHGDVVLATREQIEKQAQKAGRHRQIHKNILNELSDLRRTPADERPALIRRATRRFRSPFLAELLIEESRKRVRNAPAEAADLAALVPGILGWTLEERPVPAWGPALLARAAAHHANALRVAGDLPAAELAFARLRRRLADQPLAEPGVSAEIDSLEASLCIGQRRFEQAEDRLDRALLQFSAAGDSDGLLRARIKLANLLHSTDRAAEVLPLLDLCDIPIDPSIDKHLYLCAVTARANALCELNRYDQADSLLVAHIDLYEDTDDPFAGAVYRNLHGRVALGQGRVEDAEESFRDSRDGMLTLGRAYDAALAGATPVRWTVYRFRNSRAVEGLKFAGVR